MNNLHWGVSIYPDKSELQKISDYLDLASKNGASRVFLNYIGILEKKDSELINKFAKIIKIAKSKGLTVVLDINKSTCDELKINLQEPDLTSFKDLGIDVLRLDDQFNGKVEALMAMNREGIGIELNASLFNEYIANVLSYGINPNQITACHNFYPQKYSGLSYEKYCQSTQKIHDQHVKVGAFVSLQNEKSQGPWEVFEKLPTLEIHRNLPLLLQVNHLIANELADYVLISTQFATQKDIDELKRGLQFKKIIPFTKAKNLNQTEQEILDYRFHYLRGDLSEYLLRSTQTRKIFANQKIPKRKSDEKIIKRGAIVIPNDRYGKYKGELQIITQDIENDGQRNLVGWIEKEHLFLLDTITPWSHFELKENE